MTFEKALKEKRLFFDGAMGTMLQARGLALTELPEALNIKSPEVIEDIHDLYIKAGCDIIKTNSFGANSIKLHGTGLDSYEITRAAISVAKKAASRSDKKVYVAADFGPTGKLLMPIGDLSFELAYDAYAQALRAAQEEGADLILFETFSDTYELKAAVLAAKENTNLPIVCTVMADENGKLLTGAPVEGVAAMLEGLGVCAVGLNCGIGPTEMQPIAKRIFDATSLPVVVNPNAGLPATDRNGRTYYDITARQFALSTTEIAEYANILGGCCGTTPEYIKALIDKAENIPLPPEHEFTKTVVTSGSSAVVLGEGTVIIGERINPTGKPLFKQALRENNIEYILKEGIAQQESGAHILDVNVGLPDIDEKSMLPFVVERLQGVTSLPLQLDTSDAVALERALRTVNGKPLINSVNGKKESLQSFLPLAKKYGGVVVALALDEKGIPDTVEGRVEIAKRIIAEAEKIGIKKRDILIDLLTLTISTGSSAKVTLDGIREIKKLGVGTILGVSNISFGLPLRENINSAFLSMAIEAGLDAAIMNPSSKAMMDSYHSAMALCGYDKNCQNYIERFSDTANEKKPVKPQNTGIEQAIKTGLCESARSAATELLQKEEPMSIVQHRLVPALDEVGALFEKGKMFLPQLLMSAEAAQAAFDQIKAHILLNGGEPVKKSKIVIATVKGDIHDIGKNIVKVLLDNYGYNVVDLGKDVSPETVVQRAIEEKAEIVALSALMTTTLPAMEQTIKLVKEKIPHCKTIVGGAVLTPEYAEKIGADAYAKDATEAVRCCRELIG